MKLRIFIGSSSEQLAVTEAVRECLESNHEPTVWSDGIFGLSQDTLTGLLNTLEKSDAAVFIFAPDDLTRIRSRDHSTVRDNVVFELGLFMGKLGRERTFFIVPEGEEKLHLPSDLTGVIYATYSSGRIYDDAKSAVASACDKIKRELSKWMKNQAKIQIDSPFEISEARAWFSGQMEYVLCQLIERAKGFNRLPTRIKRLKSEIVWSDGRREVRLAFGRIEDTPSGDNHLVALPANDLFDDHCFQDLKGAMGNCIKAWFPKNVDSIRNIVYQQLAKESQRRSPIPVATSETQLSLSYGVGKCVYLDKPLEVDRRMAFISTSTKRAKVGLHSDGGYILTALRAICHLASEQKIDTVYLPVLGGGKGGMVPQMALLSPLSVLRYLFDQNAGEVRVLKSVSVIVFKKDNATDPEIDPNLAWKLLALAMRDV